MSNTTKFLIAALAVVTMLAGEARHASASIQNGSFEDTTGFVPTSPTSDNTMSLSFGSTVMSNWTVAGTTNAGIAWIGPSNPFGLTASAGSYFLDLTNYSSNPALFGGVSQTVTTTPGTTYALSFDLGSDSRWNGSTSPPGTATVAVTGGTNTQSFNFTTSTTNAWTSKTMLFTATSASTVITIQGTGGNNYIGLDNVSLNAAVPEPAAVVTWLLLSGLGCVAVASGRWKQPAE